MTVQVNHGFQRVRNGKIENGIGKSTNRLSKIKNKINKISIINK